MEHIRIAKVSMSTILKSSSLAVKALHLHTLVPSHPDPLYDLLKGPALLALWFSATLTDDASPSPAKGQRGLCRHSRSTFPRNPSSYAPPSHLPVCPLWTRSLDSKKFGSNGDVDNVPHNSVCSKTEYECHGVCGTTDTVSGFQFYHLPFYKWPTMQGCLRKHKGLDCWWEPREAVCFFFYSTAAGKGSEWVEDLRCVKGVWKDGNRDENKGLEDLENQ